ncbi:T9SS-dependent choice-of-anchor J family protein [Aequorivita antarctica]|uniref:T9SS type A sorting domain-containing protein n=1 Tax=Aequorivita antarctica TaxID=153266 RepID=A0A5C6YYX4_9FLAO|nr:choice-of-anchor J domain-containing protein [Aequorivita antarctica]TXD72945.1 T9SS type A sorting domain-containing protein [Aequorivita antarctica]SRX74648.1 Lys-gingipain W83 [Aequorivita antarctica]
MKKITLLAALFAGFAMNAQTTIFEDDFEAYDDFLIDNVGDWTLTDLDLLPTYGFTGITFLNSGYTGSFIVFNSTTTDPPLDPTADSNWAARGGEKAMTSFAAVPDGTTNANNDWLISPQITLGISGNLLSFWAKAADATYSEETFNIGVSTTDTDTGSFILLETGLVPQAIDWEEFTVDLDAYAGQDVYIAINHVGADQFGFQVDDYKVTADVLGVNDLAFKGFKYFVANNQLILSANTSMDKIALYNMLGQQVVSQKLTSTNETVSISGLQSGIYIATVSIDGANKSFKIVKN